jgi:hypothetical protein
MVEQQLGIRGVTPLDLEEPIVQGDHVPVHLPHQGGEPALVVRVSPPGVVAGTVVVADERRLLQNSLAAGLAAGIDAPAAIRSCIDLTSRRRFRRALIASAAAEAADIVVT